MFANVLRSSARFGLLQAARASAPAATRSLSSRVSLRAVAPAATAFAVRAFSSTPSTLARNPPSNTLFIGSISWGTTAEELKQMFEDFGPIEGEVRMPVSYDGRPRGFAHITFKDEASAIAAVNSANEEPLHLGGRDLTLDFATQREARSAPAASIPNNKIYFSGFEQGEAGIRELFQDHEADIISVFLLRDGTTGASLPTGFVEFNSIEVAEQVINEFNGHELPSGNKLVVSYARPRKERTEGNSFGNRRGGDNRRDSGRSSHYSNRGYNNQRSSGY